MGSTGPDGNFEGNVKSLLNEGMATPASHKKSGGFKASQFWINKIQGELSEKEFAKLAQFSLVARYQQTNSYDQVSRNPGEFATDLSNRYIESLGFPPNEFYVLMKNPEDNRVKIDNILSNIPDELIELFSPWYDEFMNNEDDSALNNKENDKEPEEFLALKKKQFMALAAFGAITWGANKAIADAGIAQQVKSNIIQYKKDHPEAFQPIMDKFDASRKNVTDASKQPPEFSDQIYDIYNSEENKSELISIQEFNDPYPDMLESLKSRFSAFAEHDKYGLDDEGKRKCKEISGEMTRLYDQIVMERTTGKKLSPELVQEIESFVSLKVFDDPDIQAIEDKQKTNAIVEFKSSIPSTHQFNINDLSNAIQSGDKKQIRDLVAKGVPLDPDVKTTKYKRGFFTKIKDVFTKPGGLGNLITAPERNLSKILDISDQLPALSEKLKSNSTSFKAVKPEESEHHDLDPDLSHRLYGLSKNAKTPELDVMEPDLDSPDTVVHGFSNIQNQASYVTPSEPNLLAKIKDHIKELVKVLQNPDADPMHTEEQEVKGNIRDIIISCSLSSVELIKIKGELTSMPEEAQDKAKGFISYINEEIIPDKIKQIESQVDNRSKMNM